MNLEKNYDFTGIKEKLKELKEQADIIKESLEKMDILIKDSVGIEGDAWQGAGATELRNKWEEYSGDIMTYVGLVQTQYENLELINKVMGEEDKNTSVE